MRVLQGPQHYVFPSANRNLCGYFFSSLLALRFRDLVTAPGDTLSSHKDIIAAKDSVWWGWWNKFGETPPREVFRTLKARASVAAPIEVYLVDTGHMTVHKASLASIEYADDRIESPSKEHTPAYYRDSKYLAWFKLIQISDAIPAEELQEWSYVKVDAFFVDGVDHFDAFENKVVWSVPELRAQDRTIWFLRPKEGTDGHHEIILHDAKQFTPHHFPKQIRSSPKKDLLWTSDLHFGPHHRFGRNPQATGMHLWDVLERSAIELKLDIAGLLISGDFTWSAEEAEFAAFSEFLTRFASAVRLDNYDILTCPGNHDLPFSDVQGQNVVQTTPQARERYNSLYRKLYYIDANDWICSGRRFLLDDGIPVEVACLNSSSLQQHPKAFQGYGFVGSPQMDEVQKQMNWKDRTKHGYRIVMLHHHLVPVTDMELPAIGARYSLALDAQAIIKWCHRNKVDLVLHGHMHQPSLVTVTSATGEHLAVCGLGSTGVDTDHLGECRQNTFAALRFTSDNLEVRVFSLSPERGSRETDRMELWTLKRQA